MSLILNMDPWTMFQCDSGSLAGWVCMCVCEREYSGGFAWGVHVCVCNRFMVKMPCWIQRQFLQFHYSACINKIDVVHYLVYQSLINCEMFLWKFIDIFPGNYSDKLCLLSYCNCYGWYCTVYCAIVQFSPA